MAGHELTLHLTGGGPWGFRLFGGEHEPLVIAKLRKRSKAQEARLAEGDVLLGINNHSCKGMSHATAMGLIDSSGHTMSMIVLRGSADKNAIDASYNKLGNKPVPSSAMPQQQSTGHMPQYGQSQSSQPQRPLQVASMNGPTQPNVYRDHQTFVNGNTIKQVTTETKAEQFGSTRVTKVKREEVSHTGFGGGPAPQIWQPPSQPSCQPPSMQQQQPSLQQQQPQFKVPKFVGGPTMPGVWTPSGGSGVTVCAPAGVNITKNPDQSITMDISMDASDSKENVAPQRRPQVPMFNVSKVQRDKGKGLWQPAGAPVPPPKPHPPQPSSQQHHQGLSPLSSIVDITDMPIWKTHAKEDMHQNNTFSRDNAPLPLHMCLQRVVTEGSGSDEGGPDSPATLSRKKMFADSAFYDDPEHKYPTIEEQIKMARRVAFSLSSAANQRARGQRMFMKRKKKSMKWTIDHVDPNQLNIHKEFTEYSYKDESEEEADKYYNPSPWKPAHTWQPLTVGPGTVRPANINTGSMAGTGSMWGEIPKPPPLPSKSLFAPPVIPTEEKKAKALSADEFERMRLFESKTEHTGVSPQVCFSLAEDLKQMKGRGGKLFAKRVARSEKWVHGENTAPNVPNPDIMRKLAAGTPGPDQFQQASHPTPSTQNQMETSGAPVNRLKAMINPPKPKMTPWDAEAFHGNVDLAFEHLDGYFKERNQTFDQSVASNLTSATEKQKPPPPVNRPVNSQPAKLPEFTRKIAPWEQNGANTSLSGAANAGPGPNQVAFSPGSSLKSKSPSPASGTFFASTSPAAASQPSGFRPITFEAGAAKKVGVFNGTSGVPAWQPPSGPTTPPARVSKPKEITSNEGFCDL